MARWAIFDLLNMFFCSTFHALSNRKKNIFVPIEMTTLCNSTFFQRLLHRLLGSQIRVEIEKSRTNIIEQFIQSPLVKQQYIYRGCEASEKNNRYTIRKSTLRIEAH